jgi:hypothetical protein
MKKFTFDAKLERAKQHVSDFKVAEQAFLQRDPYTAVHYNEIESRDRIIRFETAEECPEPMLALLGDAVHNFRSALDHLAYSLAEKNRRPLPDKSLSFAIYSSEAAFKADRPQRIKRFGESATVLIDALQPYQGGNSTLCAIDELDNIDKHRLLITTMQSTTGATSFGLRADPLRGSFVRNFPFGPLKSGTEIRIPHAQIDPMNMNIEFRFRIAFGEVRESLTVTGALDKMSEFLTGAFEPFRKLL